MIANTITVSITVVQAFVLIPLALAHVGPGLYAAWLAASEVLIWIQMLDAGLPNLLIQRAGMLVGQRDLAEAARWSSTTFVGLMLLGIGIAVVAALAAPAVAAWVIVPAPDRSTFVDCFRTGALSAVVLLLSNGCVALGRGLQRPGIMNAALVAGAAAGLVVSIVLLPLGWGLWALAAGLAARAGITAVGAILFLRSLPAVGVSWWAQPGMPCAREMRVLLPSLFVGNVSNVLANHSELLLVTSLLGPMPALVYALTRRAFDGLRNLLDTVAWAVAGGFAHLVGGDDRHRARSVLREVLYLRLTVASLAGAVVVSINGSFVTLLYGGDHFGGVGLTVAFGLQLIAVGQFFLANYLWRSAGAIREGSFVLTLEAMLRVAGMAGGVLLFGLIGAPLAASLVSLLGVVYVRRTLARTLPAGHVERLSRPQLAAPGLAFAAGTLVALIGIPASWSAVGVTLSAIGCFGLGLLWLSAPPGTLRTLTRGI